MTSHRKFNGKHYELFKVFKSKHDAQKTAERIRAIGWNARVIRFPLDKTRWAVYRG